MKLVKRMLHSKTLTGSLIVLLFWYALHLTLNSAIIPSPYAAFVEFFKLLQGDLLLHILVSLYRIIAAVLISLAIGLPLGLWAGLSRRADRFISPVAYILYPIPKIAFLPVFMILFGLGDTSKIILIIAVIVFQIMLAARDGVKEIPGELFHSVKSLGLSRAQTYINLVLPAVLPKTISALRISTGISISVLFFAENFATAYGIGHYIMNSWTMADYTGLFAGILALSIMGIAVFKLIDLLEKKLCPWVFIHQQSA